MKKLIFSLFIFPILIFFSNVPITNAQATLVQYVTGDSSSSSVTSSMISATTGNVLVATASGADSSTCTPTGSPTYSISDTETLTWTEIEGTYRNGRVCGNTWYTVLVSDVVDLQVTATISTVFLENSHIIVTEWNAPEGGGGGGDMSNATSTTNQIQTNMMFATIVFFASIVFIIWIFK